MKTIFGVYLGSKLQGQGGNRSEPSSETKITGRVELLVVVSLGYSKLVIILYITNSLDEGSYVPYMFNSQLSSFYFFAVIHPLPSLPYSLHLKWG